DTLNMLDIHRKFGGRTLLNKLPTLTLTKRFRYYNIKRIENIFLLNYLDYDRQQAKKLLTEEYGWREYPIKHGESVFTRFYQRYILPKRFGIDYRKAHLSSLICNGQISREAALKILESEILDETTVKRDKEYVLKKLNITSAQFDTYMTLPKCEHLHFRSEIKL